MVPTTLLKVIKDNPFLEDVSTFYKNAGYQLYLVGGAVRDKLLGLEPKENDWVVVNSNQKELLDLGYKQVGKQFPVFLHPKTSEEYALARLEKKIDRGHKGFEFDTSKSVTLEQD